MYAMLFIAKILKILDSRLKIAILFALEILLPHMFIPENQIYPVITVSSQKSFYEKRKDGINILVITVILI